MPTSLDLYLPFDAGAGANVTEDNWRKMARHWLGSGVLSNEDNELQVYGDSSGMQVKVKIGKGMIRGHYGETTVEKILPIAANASGNPRIDRVVLRGDFVNNRLEVDIIQGTPAASPAAPAVTQNTSIWEQSLAQVAVANGAVTIAAGNVTDERDAIWLFGSRNVPYRSYTPTFFGNAGGTAFTLGNGTVSGRWRRNGRSIRGRAKFVMGSTSVAPAGNLVVTLPVSASAQILLNEPIAGRLMISDASAAPAYFWANPLLATSGGGGMYFRNEAGAAVTTNGTPITLATGDVLIVEFEYESDV